MNRISNSALNYLCFTFLWLVAFESTQALAGFITIDSFTTPQQVLVAGSGSNTGTTASSGAIGGYRTLSLTSLNTLEFGDSKLTISALSKHLSMSSDSGVTVTAFSYKWAGATGSGFAPQNMLTLPSGMNSEVQFGLHSSDQAGVLTWTFTDVANKVSSATINVPVHSSSSSPIPMSLRLNNFSNPSGFDWTQITSVELSGGGVPEWDFTLDGFVVIGVPEPNLAFLLCAGLSFAVPLVRRRSLA